MSAARNPKVETLETFDFWGKHQRGFGKMREAGKEEFPLLLIPVAALKSCSIFAQRNARTKPKTHRKKQPMVLVCMDTISVKAFKQGCAHLPGFNPKPCKADGKSPKNFKVFGIKALYL